MAQFLTNNIGTIAVSLILLAIVSGIVASMARGAKKGRHIGCDCASCGACGRGGGCNMAAQGAQNARKGRRPQPARKAPAPSGKAG